MKSVLLCSLLLAAAAKATIKTEEDVLVLTEANFDDAIKQYGDTGLLVEFYAPWCGHCKKLAPEYAKAAADLKKENLFVAKVDATVEKELGERFGVSGYPTLKFFRGGKPVEYNGARDAAGIASWIRKKTGPAAVTLATQAEAAAFKAKASVTVIGFAAPASAAGKAILAAAAGIEDIPVAVTDAAEVRAAHKVEGVSVVLFNDFEGEENVISFGGDATDSAAITKWVEGNSLPAVVAFSQDTAPKIFRGPVTTHMLLFIDAAAEASKETLAEFRAAALANKGAALFVTVAPSEDRVASYFGVAAADMPTLVLVHMPPGGSSQMKKYKYTAALKTAEMSAFLAEYQAGALKPFLKSEEEPEATKEAAASVATIVGTTFEKVVLDSSKDVLLEVYAPWCGHCKSLAPIYEELGKAVKASTPNIVIAKMDGTANEVDYPGFNVKGFPTIIFFPATTDGSKKKLVEYDGARDLAGFTAFLKKSATHGAELTGAAATADDDEYEEDDSEDEL